MEATYCRGCGHQPHDPGRCRHVYRDLGNCACGYVSATGDIVVAPVAPVGGDLAATLKERGERYGPFADHAEIAQRLKALCAAAPGWSRLDAAQREALEMILHKIARILNGDPNHADSWLDVAGYAQLIVASLAAGREGPAA